MNVGLRQRTLPGMMSQGGRNDNDDDSDSDDAVNTDSDEDDLTRKRLLKSEDWYM